MKVLIRNKEKHSSSATSELKCRRDLLSKVASVINLFHDSWMSMPLLTEEEN